MNYYGPRINTNTALDSYSFSSPEELVLMFHQYLFIGSLVSFSSYTTKFRSFFPVSSQKSDTIVWMRSGSFFHGLPQNLSSPLVLAFLGSCWAGEHKVLLLPLPSRFYNSFCFLSLFYPSIRCPST